MACNYVTRSVTLQPNEPFNLPPGAELISATDINSLTSTCPLPSTLEPLECWIIPIGMTEADSGDNNSIWMSGADLGGSKGIGITINDTFYPYIMPQGFEGEPQLGGFVSYVSSNPALSGLLLDPSTLNAYDPGKGGAASFCFKAPASIAKTTHITWQTGVDEPGLVGNIYARFYAVPYATFTGEPKCSCTLPPTT